MSGIAGAQFVDGILRAAGQKSPWASPSPAAPPTPEQTQQRQQIEVADARSAGRSDTILTDYALATKKPSTLKETLGA